MKLPDATSMIRQTARRMDADRGQPVFDEFAIVQLADDRN